MRPARASSGARPASWRRDRIVGRLRPLPPAVEDAQNDRAGAVGHRRKPGSWRGVIYAKQAAPRHIPAVKVTRADHFHRHPAQTDEVRSSIRLALCVGAGPHPLAAWRCKSPSPVATGEGRGGGQHQCHGALFPMIGVAGEDLLGAVKLFEQHPAHQQMRPGHRAQRQHGVGVLGDGAAEPLGAADREGECRDPLVAPRREPLGEVAARPACPPLVERDEPGTRRQCREDQLGLARPQRLGWQLRRSSSSTIAGGGVRRAA